MIGAAERPSNNGKSPSPSSQWSSQEIRGTVGGGSMPWQCVPDRVYPVSGYGPPKNINQQVYQNRSNSNNNNINNNNNPEMMTIKSPPAVDSNRNNAITATDDAKNTAVGQLQSSIKSSKSFESGVLGQHANTPNGIIPWPGDHRKPRSSQWEHHNNAVYNSGPSSPYNNGSSSSPYNNGLPSLHNGPELFLGNRSLGVRSSSRGPTYFSPQHNHVSTYILSHISPFFLSHIIFSSSFSVTTLIGHMDLAL